MDSRRPAAACGAGQGPIAGCWSVAGTDIIGIGDAPQPPPRCRRLALFVAREGAVAETRLVVALDAERIAGADGCSGAAPSAANPLAASNTRIALHIFVSPRVHRCIFGSMTPTEQPRSPFRQHILQRNTAPKFKCEIFAARLRHKISKSARNASLTYTFSELVSHSLLP